MPYSIKIYNTIKEAGLKQFSGKDYSVSHDEVHPDAIICRSAKLHDEPIDANVKIIVRAGVGVNNIPIEKCTKNGIVVSNTPGANSTAVKELVIAGMIMASRNLHHSMKWIQFLKKTTSQQEDRNLTSLVEQEKSKLAGREIHKKTLGIIGLGAIGQKLAQSCMDLGMKVIGFDPYLPKQNVLYHMQNFTKTNNLDDLVAKSHYVSIHVPYSEATHHLINASLLSKCKKHCILLNFARAELVNEKDIIQALDTKNISVYITDFPTERLLQHPSVLSMPHLGASTKESEENCAVMACDQVCQYLKYGNIVHSVNFPSCSMELSPAVKTRLLISNHNNKNVIANIASTLNAHNINIENMINKHKQNLAYNIIDTNNDIDESLIQKLYSLQDIIFVRSISL